MPKIPDDIPDPVPHRLARGGRSDPNDAGVPYAPVVPPADPPPPEFQGDGYEGGIAASDAIEYRRLLSCQAARKMEALRLYEPLPIQAEFHASRAHQRLLRGSNRAGKTLAPAVELARAVTGRDPFEKFPARDGRAYVIGRDEKHIGEVMYRKLFKPGAFRIVRDHVTGEWRAFRPWDPADKGRKKESKPAPQLIPRRYIKSLTWRNKGASVPEKVVLTTGWEIDFFSSLGKPPRGADLDLVWFDEEIVDGDWHPEMMARLLDRSGVLMWGATPQTGTDRLLELHLRCEREYEEWLRRGAPADDQPDVRECVILLADNPHIGETEKRKLAEDLDEQDYAIRIGGEFAIQAAKIYPEFSLETHSLPYFDIPPDWTRFAVVDPGRQICAVLFAAVPPPDATDPRGVAVGDNLFVYLYDELYIPNCSAGVFGERMAQKCAGQEFEAFVIDTHGSRVTEAGSGLTVEGQYAAALRANGVSSARTGSGFAWGSDDVQGGIEAVRGWLRIRPEVGLPTVLLVDGPDRLPNFVYEIARYRYKRIDGRPTDKPEDRGRVHLMADLRYLALYRPTFVEPSPARRRATGALAAFQRKMARRKSSGGNPETTNFGPRRRT